MKQSSLTCIFRVAGDDLDIEAIISGAKIQPFRIGRISIGKAKTNALHYEISAAAPATSSELAAAILEFLKKNKQDIFLIRQSHGAEQLVLDVALIIDEGIAMRTLALNQPLLEVVTAAGISCEISAYRS